VQFFPSWIFVKISTCFLRFWPDFLRRFLILWSDLLIFFAVSVSQFSTVKVEASLGPCAQLTIFLEIVVAAGFIFTFVDFAAVLPEVSVAQDLFAVSCSCLRESGSRFILCCSICAPASDSSSLVVQRSGFSARVRCWIFPLPSLSRPRSQGVPLSGRAFLLISAQTLLTRWFCEDVCCSVLRFIRAAIH
jgi:hypothetical protein